jgi:hypothetical protein
MAKILQYEKGDFPTTTILFSHTVSKLGGKIAVMYYNALCYVQKLFAQ